MKQIQDIVKEHIARTGELVHDHQRMMAEAQRLDERLAKRSAADPALSIFVRHYADGLAAALTIVPEVTRPFVIKNLLMQVIVEWEDIHEEFSNQLNPSPNERSSTQ